MGILNKISSGFRIFRRNSIAPSLYPIQNLRTIGIGPFLFTLSGSLLASASLYKLIIQRHPIYIPFPAIIGGIVGYTVSKFYTQNTANDNNVEATKAKALLENIYIMPSNNGFVLGTGFKW